MGVSTWCGLLVNGVFKRFTWFELGYLGSLNLESCACAWIAACTCGAFGNAERPKTNQRQGVSLFQALEHGILNAC